ncbi:MAG: DNA topoisomerase (ATP-hydrolyzing) subunit A [Oscillospiraceae bacterium]|nr:DNA topoisomerase (ATP-hydrolyzing) subunit A [Oscillospiraceae bacterium]
MAKKKSPKKDGGSDDLLKNTHIAGAGETIEQPITDTLEINYMPYAMSVILSRAIPEIDGFKPSHRKLLYTMYKMGLLGSKKIKSANIVGQTMRLNPHGDGAIYETMVRLSRGNEALLNPYVDSKGNFGKAYSRDMHYAASRYTEAKLESICAELFGDIDKNTVDFVDNYDSTTKEPTLLPVTFPSILANVNLGIAVGMASSICSFNLTELCETTIELIKNQEHDCIDTMPAPDFVGGGRILYDREAMKEIYRTGRGNIRVRSKYNYDKEFNCIDVTEIPPTTTAEAIIDKIIEKVKAGSVKEITDIRDETDKQGLKITIDLKRGTDPDKLMQKLYKMTPLEDTFSCNFNVLIDGYPKVLGVRELLLEWIRFRGRCVHRRVSFDLDKAQQKLHLLRGLEKILLDIDKAISIIRKTEEESEVVPNLMIGFGIDEIQAEYVAEIKLRHLNREYILKRLKDIEDLEANIKDYQDILASKSRVRKIIIAELKEVIKKYGKERKSEILEISEVETEDTAEEIPDYAVNLFFTKEGYFKKITPLSLRMGGEHKLKENDEIVISLDTTNHNDLLFFTDKCQVYKAKVSDFADSKASVLGEYIPSKLEMDEGETPIFMCLTRDYEGFMFFLFHNGKAAKVSLSSYATKTNRKKLIKAYSDKSPLAGIMQLKEDGDVVIETTSGRCLLLNTALISPKAMKDTQGVACISLKKSHRITKLRPYTEDEFAKESRYRAKNLPAAGALLSQEDTIRKSNITLEGFEV